MNDTRRVSAEREIGRRHPYLVVFGGRAFAALVVLLVVAGAVWLARWAVTHLPAPSVPHPSAPNWSIPFGWIALGFAALLGVTLLVRRIVRYVRYGV